MNRIIVVIVSFLLSATLFGQKNENSFKSLFADLPYERVNVIKLNLASLGFRNPTIFYERAIMPRVTGVISAGIRYKGQSMAFFTTNDSNLEIDLGAIGGFSFAPEIRYYLKNCCDDNFLTGFYGGVYYKYTHMSSNAVAKFIPNSGQSEYVSGQLQLNEMGVGIQLGYQLAIFKNFTIDFQFFGPRVSFVKIKGKFNNTISDEFRDNLEEYINDVLSRLGSDYRYKIKNKTSNSISGKVSIPSVRFGICIGYAF